jgi:hypothetical protein
MLDNAEKTRQLMAALPFEVELTPNALVQILPQRIETPSSHGKSFRKSPMPVTREASFAICFPGKPTASPSSR